MRILVLVAFLLGTASAGPVLRVGAVGGYDTSAPGHREDGYVLGAGYRSGPLTAELDYAYLDYDGSTGVAGGANRIGALLQTRLVSATCRPGATCPHLDFDLGAGRRWVRWEPGQNMQVPNTDPVIERQGRELSIGLSANFGWHLALHYVLFQPDAGPQISCRGVCPMQVRGDDTGVLFEASFAFGG